MAAIDNDEPISVLVDNDLAESQPIDLREYDTFSFQVGATTIGGDSNIDAISWYASGKRDGTYLPVEDIDNQGSALAAQTCAPSTLDYQSPISVQGKRFVKGKAGTGRSGPLLVARKKLCPG